MYERQKSNQLICRMVAYTCVQRMQKRYIKRDLQKAKEQLVDLPLGSLYMCAGRRRYTSKETYKRQKRRTYIKRDVHKASSNQLKCCIVADTCIQDVDNIHQRDVHKARSSYSVVDMPHCGLNPKLVCGYSGTWIIYITRDVQKADEQVVDMLYRCLHLCAGRRRDTSKETYTRQKRHTKGGRASS